MTTEKLLAFLKSGGKVKSGNDSCGSTLYMDTSGVVKCAWHNAVDGANHKVKRVLSVYHRMSQEEGFRLVGGKI